MEAEPPFPKKPRIKVPIRELGLAIAGTPIEDALKEFEEELRNAGIRRLKPDYYLSTEWGVPFPSISIAIPFYLAHPELVEVHRDKHGYLEGADRADFLQLLRHEMGHVANYAYKLYEQEEWASRFGSMTQPYIEEYRPIPFSRRYVVHLDGWYAQKHPDEDWAETFAVWLTPHSNWRERYREWPEALAKLHYCERIIAEIGDREPLVTATDHDEDVSELKDSIENFYRGLEQEGVLVLPPGIDGALLSIFENTGEQEQAELSAEALILRLERELVACAYRWTGHQPEAVRKLIRHLAERSKELRQVYRREQEEKAVVALTTLVTALSMNFVLRGHYLP